MHKNNLAILNTGFTCLYYKEIQVAKDQGLFKNNLHVWICALIQVFTNDL